MCVHAPVYVIECACLFWHLVVPRHALLREARMIKNLQALRATGDLLGLVDAHAAGGEGLVRGGGSRTKLSISNK